MAVEKETSSTTCIVQPLTAEMQSEDVAGIVDTETTTATTQSAPDVVAAAARTAPTRRKAPKAQIPCKFFGTPGGCRAGQQCPFSHSIEGEPSTSGTGQTTKGELTLGNEAKSKPVKQPRRQYQARPVDPSRIVHKPEPATRVSKRDHQIQQVKRRFNAVDTSTVDATILSFKLQPTDPDFPYELEALDCVLQIPKSYPEDEPHLSIHNKEMEKGFCINIENGFDSIVRSLPSGNLLSWLNALDRQLEGLLSGKKADTIKFVANRPLEAPSQQSVPAPSTRIEIAIQHTVVPVYQPSYTSAQREAATLRREANTRQLEARLGRQAMYAKSSDGIAYTLPIEPRKKHDLPAALQNVRSVRLFVPMLYPLLPCRIALQGVLRESAQGVEQAFEQKVKDSPETTLVGHINYLVTHMHLMAAETQTKADFEADQIGIDELDLSSDEPEDQNTIKPTGDTLDDKNHLHFIPRPPEWSVSEQRPAGHEPDESSDGSDISESEEDTKLESVSAPERGVSIDFPHLELHGIELLTVTSLSLTVRCSRCKESTDVENIHHTEPSKHSSRVIACKKCASEMSIAFHQQLIHTNSIRAGYLDLDNCTIADMLLSKFAPTCSNCSTTYSDPGVAAVRGDTTLAICRKCHTKMSFKLSEVKFLLVSSSSKLLPLRKVKKTRENLGIRAGEPLPRHGRCKHYAKSYRWFRFGCCAKVYPCDRCHDEKEAHPNEHANRMICGYCSREQRYRPEDCGICKAMLVGKRYTGFWEGGQGTRDKTRMSRKDPRKYKRRGGTAVGSS